MAQRRRKDVGDTPSKIKGDIIGRVTLLYGLFAVLSIVVIVVIVLVQVGSSGDTLRQRGERYAHDSEILLAQRGNILSDDGRVLTTSIPMYELRMDFAAPGLLDSVFNSSISALSDSLANFFGNKSAEEYQEDLTEARAGGHRYYRLAPRKVNFIDLQRIREFPLINLGVAKSGFIAEKSFQRVRPYGNVASRTLGFVNSTGVRLGVEGSFDDILRGVDGLTIKQKISGNFWIPIESQLNVEPKDGTDVETTINIEIQDIAQTALRERIVEVEADWGTIVVMEVETGYVKALANITRTETGELVEDYNYAVGTSMEPGSTFKLPVLLALIDDANIPLDRVIDTESGRVRVGIVDVVDAHRGGFGELTVEGVIAKSSNIGMAKMVNSVFRGRESDFVDRILGMGVGNDLGLQISGEPKPRIKHPKVSKSGWDGMSMIMMSYGYALQITPLQTLAIYNGLANGGRVMRPLLVSALRENGEVVKEYLPEVITEQLASDKAIGLAKRSLEAAVEYGTARDLQSPLYKVAAKTGTAQIAMGRSGYRAADGSMHYLGSVAGYFPADKPKYSVIIAFKTHYKPGSGKTYYGGSLAAPLFRVVADNIYNSSYEFITPYEGSRGGEVVEASGRLARVGGSGGGAVEVDSLGVPQVKGRRLDDAVGLLESAGYKVRSAGRGFVKEQRLAEDGLVELILEL